MTSVKTKAIANSKQDPSCAGPRRWPGSSQWITRRSWGCWRFQEWRWQCKHSIPNVIQNSNTPTPLARKFRWRGRRPWGWWRHHLLEMMCLFVQLIQGNENTQDLERTPQDRQLRRYGESSDNFSHFLLQSKPQFRPCISRCRNGSSEAQWSLEIHLQTRWYINYYHTSDS